MALDGRGIAEWRQWYARSTSKPALDVLLVFLHTLASPQVLV
jgi:hypothetical protein